MKKYTSILISFIFCFSVVHPQSSQIANSIVVGGVTSNSARFWVRTLESIPINIQLSESSSFTNPILGEEKVTSPENQQALIIDVKELKSNTKYYYRAISGESVIDSEVRSFLTFPIVGSSNNFSFAFGSCQQSGHFEYGEPDAVSVFDEIVQHDLRFFLQLGDWGYPDTTDNFPEDNNFFSAHYNLVQESYHNKYNKDYHMDQILRSMPVDYVYDDHDYMSNNSSANTSSYYIPYRPNPISNDDFVASEIPNPAGARENSIKGYKENFPGYDLVNESRGIYHKFTFGNIEVFALDLRSQKSPALNGFLKNTSTNKWEFNPPEGHSILGHSSAVGEGENQIDWFLNGLKNSTAVWKFIMSSVPFNIGQRAAMDAGLLLQDIPINIEGAPVGTTAIAASFELADSWTGFPDDQTMLLNFIEENNIKNVIILSGDSHNSALDDGENAGLPEIMSGNLDITNSRTVSLFQSFGIEIWNKGGQGVNTEEYNDAFGKVTVFGSDSVRLSLIDEYGNLFAQHTIASEAPVAVDENIIMNNFSLEQNYPNPFNPSTNIRYILPEKSAVTLRIFNVLGKEVKSLINRDQTAGSYSLEINLKSLNRKLSSGVYFYNLIAVGSESGIVFSQTKKMMILK